MRLSIALALALALLTPSADNASARSGITLKGSRPQYIRISLPEGARVQNPWAAEAAQPFRISGRGNFVGFALVEDSPKPHHVFLGGRLPRSADGRLFFFDMGGFADSISAKAIIVPKGDYRFYLLPSEGKASVSLPIDQPVRVIDPQPRPASLRTPSLVTFGAPPTPNVQSAGATAELNGDGLLFNAVWFANQAHVASNHDACFWRNAPSEPAASLPACGSTPMAEPANLWASQGTIDYASSTGADMRLYYGSWMPSEAGFKKGRFGQSYSIQTASAAERLDSLGIWLQFDA